MVPLLSVWRAYYRLQREKGIDDYRERWAREIELHEVSILGEMLCRIGASLGRARRGMTVLGGGDEEHGPAFREASAVADRVEEVYDRLRCKQGTHRPLPRRAEGGGASVGTGPQARAGQIFGAVESEGSDAKDLRIDNALHALWHMQHEFFVDRVREFAGGVAEKGSRQARLHSLEEALWVRPPEVRALMDVVLDDARRQDITVVSREAGAAPVDARDRDELVPGEVVSIIECNVFWDGPLDYATWSDIRPWPAGTHWVVGSHDFQLVRRRYAGMEHLGRSVKPVSAIVPERPARCFVRSIDYEVCSYPASIPAKGTFHAHAFLQLRFRRPITAEALAERLGSIITGGRACGGLGGRSVFADSTVLWLGPVCGPDRLQDHRGAGEGVERAGARSGARVSDDEPPR